MNKLLKVVTAVTVAGLLGASGAVYAATVKSPAEITSEVTGKTAEELAAERSAGKTYGMMAEEAGKLEEFKDQMLEQRKAMLDQRVAEGRLTQEQADAMLETMKNNQANCDGTGNARMGAPSGMGAGKGMGMGNGGGMGKRSGDGTGMGRGVNR